MQKVSPAATSQNLPKPLLNSQQLVKVGRGNLFETRIDDFFDRAKASCGLVRPSNPSRVDNSRGSGRRAERAKAEALRRVPKKWDPEVAVFLKMGELFRKLRSLRF